MIGKGKNAEEKKTHYSMKVSQNARWRPSALMWSTREEAKKEQEKIMLSIVIPAYNVERYLNRCMESVLSQSYRDLEILLINDGSTDGTGALCEEFAKRDSRIIYVEKQNEGQAAARNMGIRMARGEYLTFLDADDWIDSDMFEKMYNCFARWKINNY